MNLWKFSSGLCTYIQWDKLQFFDIVGNPTEIAKQIWDEIEKWERLEGMKQDSFGQLGSSLVVEAVSTIGVRKKSQFPLTLPVYRDKL